jgi:hypothetical protein
MIKKISIRIITLVAAIAFCFGMIGCQSADLPVVGYSNVITGYEKLDLTLNAGETYTVDINEHFKDTGIDFVKYELLSSNPDVVSINKNILTAVDSGMVEIQVTLYDKTSGGDGLFAHFSTLGSIYVINEATMTPITTAQQLADIKNDMSGKYILKADIDLKDWGEWVPIGSFFENNKLALSIPFEGMFINLDDFIIKNFVISTNNLVNDVGLFASMKSAFINGIILEGVQINCSSHNTGGIAGSIFEGKIANCSISGNIQGGRDVGGIVGVNTYASILDCDFTGSLEAIWNEDLFASGIGGIVGEHYTIIIGQYYKGIIKNCDVYADIVGYNFVNAGGILGYTYVAGYDEFFIEIVDCSFVGKINNVDSKKLVGFARNGHFNLTGVDAVNIQS